MLGYNMGEDGTITITIDDLNALFDDLEANIEDTIRGTSAEIKLAQQYYISGARQMALRVFLGKKPLSSFSTNPLPGMGGFRRF